MKQNLLTILGVVLLGLMAVSCDPVKPVDETQNKLHEDPKRAELILTKGRLNADRTFAPDANAEQKVVFEIIPGKGWTIVDSSSEGFRVQVMPKEGADVYFLRIKYYSPSGALMNHQFIENGQDNIHQHFFSAYNVTDGSGVVLSKAEAKTPNLFVYEYLDTTPWDRELGSAGVTLNGQDNYLGFKGAFRFFQPDRKYSLRLRLMHSIVGKNDKGTSTYYDPPVYHKSTAHWDVDTNIPIVVVGE